MGFSECLLPVASGLGKNESAWGLVGSMQGSWPDNDSSLFTMISKRSVSADVWMHKRSLSEFVLGLNFTGTKQDEEIHDLSDKTELCLYD